MPVVVVVDLVVVPDAVGGGGLQHVLEGLNVAIHLVCVTVLLYGLRRRWSEAGVRVDRVAQVDEEVETFGAGGIKGQKLAKRADAARYRAVGVAGVSEADVTGKEGDWRCAKGSRLASASAGPEAVMIGPVRLQRKHENAGREVVPCGGERRSANGVAWRERGVCRYFDGEHGRPVGSRPENGAEGPHVPAGNAMSELHRRLSVRRREEEGQSEEGQEEEKPRQPHGTPEDRTSLAAQVYVIGAAC